MTILPLSEVKDRLSALADEVVRTHDRLRVTRNGRPSIVILADEDYEGMRLTIETLADAEEMQAIAAGLADIGAGRIHSSEEAEAAMRRSGLL